MKCRPSKLLVTPVHDLPSATPSCGGRRTSSLRAVRGVRHVLHGLHSCPNMRGTTPLIAFTFPNSKKDSCGACTCSALTVPTSVSCFVPRAKFFRAFNFGAFRKGALKRLSGVSCREGSLIMSTSLLRVLPGINQLAKGQLFCGDSSSRGSAAFFSVGKIIRGIHSHGCRRNVCSFFRPRLGIHSGRM